jgi:hypothetical protein
MPHDLFPALVKLEIARLYPGAGCSSGAGIHPPSGSRSK